MNNSVTEPVSSDDLTPLTKVARLKLEPLAERHDTVAAALDGILQLFDALDAVDLGETPPSNSFDARWRDSR